MRDRFGTLYLEGNPEDIVSEYREYLEECERKELEAERAWQEAEEAEERKYGNKEAVEDALKTAGKVYIF